MKSTPVRTLDYGAVAAHYGLEFCDYTGGCSRRISEFRHARGFADRYGRIHWTARQGDRRGLYKFLKLIAQVLQKHRQRQTPKWVRLYETCLWAEHESLHTWHIRFPRGTSYPDRQEARIDAHRRGVKLRTHHHRVYNWMYYALGKES